MKKITLLIIIMHCLILLTPLWGQENKKTTYRDFKDFSEINLEELLSTKITVASIKEMNLRESPGIVSVVTAEEIANSGARDLIDVLRLVPGLEFGVDAEGVVGIGVRGNWAHEGKVSLLWDGQEFNEPLYACLQFGNHFPVDQIKQIEIIRGPGSAIYGGYAELAVINIVTKGAKDIDGLAVSVTDGEMAKTFARRNISLSYGKEFKNDVSFIGSLLLGRGNRSDRRYTDFDGSSFDMFGNSEINPLNMNIGLDYKGFKTRIMVDQYHTTERDGFGSDLSSANPTDFDYYFVDLSYDFKIDNSVNLTPCFNYKKQTPWKSSYLDAIPTYMAYIKTVERYTEKLMLTYDPRGNMNIIAGIECYQDEAKDNLEDSRYLWEGKKEVSYFNMAGYVQGLFESPLANITLGARYDDHSIYGHSFVPRIGVTKVINNFHFKLLGSNAFRAPSMENIRINKEISPEQTTVLEFETGYQLSKKMFLVANLFDIRIDNPIVYFYDETDNTETYLNHGKVRTRGIELEYRLKYDWGYANLNYSFYTAVENSVERYAVPSNKDVLLGFPAHKVTLNSSMKLLKHLNVNPSAWYVSERYGYYKYDETGQPVMKRFDPVLLVNLFVHYPLVENLNIGIGVYDILNKKYEFIQPYDGGHSPLPGPSREIVFEMNYRY